MQLTGVYTDTNGISREMPVAVDSAGKLLDSGGVGGGGGGITGVDIVGLDQTAQPASNGLVVSVKPPRTGRIGGFNPAADLTIVANARTRSMFVANISNTPVYLQIHSKADPLVVGDVPLRGLSYQVPAQSTLIVSVSDLGESGTLFAMNTRFGISGTFNTFTPADSTVRALMSISIEANNPPPAD